MKLVLVAILALAACSGGGNKPDPENPTGGGGGSGSAPVGDGGGSAATGPITRADCEAMVGHILEVGVAATKRTRPETEWPTDEQVAQIRADMIADEKGMNDCMAFDRAAMDCVMAATTTDALQACMGAE
jgi:hypothetical protein